MSINIAIFIIEIIIIIVTNYIYFRVNKFLPPILFFPAILLVFAHAIKQLIVFFKQEKSGKMQEEIHHHTEETNQEVKDISADIKQIKELLQLSPKEEVRQELRAELQQEIEEVKAEYDKGVEYYRQFQFKQAAEHFQRALNRVKIASFYLALGTTQSYLAQNDPALENLEAALKLAQDKGNKKLEGATLNNIASVYYAWGKYDKALAYYNDSLKITQEIGDLAVKAVTMNNMARIYGQQGRTREAIGLMERVVEIDKQTRHPDYETDLSYLNRLKQRL